MKRRILFGGFMTVAVAATPFAWGAAAGAKIAAGDVKSSVVPARPGSCAGVPSAVPATGQTDCFDERGALIPCHGTAQDGELQRGVTAHPRFTDNRDGTVRDNLTGLVWLKDAGCVGFLRWNDALTAARSLAAGACALTDGSAAGDWRLPNLRELQSLLDFGRTSPALPAGHPFSNVQLTDYQQLAYYWTSTTPPFVPVAAWNVGFGSGEPGWDSKRSAARAVWPVRSDRDEGRPVLDARHLPCGNPANDAGVPSAVQKTGQTTCFDGFGNTTACAGTSQDGELRQGASIEPRFTDEGDGTVKDNLTGLIWLKDSGCLGRYSFTGALAIAGTLADGTCELTDGSAAGDWRLPNVKELQSLIDYGRSAPPLPPDHPFTQVWNYHYWSSTSLASSADRGWFVNFLGGYLGFDDKLNEFYAWPVRSAGTRSP